MSLNQCLTDKIEIYSGNATSPQHIMMPFTETITRAQADAIAHDFADHVHAETKETHTVSDISNHFGIKYEIIPQKGHTNYTMTTGLGQEVEGARGTVYVSQQITCKHPHEVLAGYSPNGTLDVLTEAQEVRIMLRNKKRWAANIGIGITELIGFWPVVFGAAKAAGYTLIDDDMLPLWTVPVLLVGAGASLVDAVYRISHNVSAFKSGILEKIERKKPAKYRH